MTPQPGSDQPLRPSLLDRLIDAAPQESREAPARQAQVLREMKQAVRRDLEALLNTRWRCTAWPPDLAELDDSLVNYGIPDFTGAHLNAAADPGTLLEVIRRAIERFEPRLRGVRVELARGANRHDRTLRFRIDATLYVDPIEDRVTYDTVLEPTTGSVRIQGTKQ